MIYRLIVHAFIGVLCIAGTLSAQPEKLRLIFVKYNNIEKTEELSLLKNNPVQAGKKNRIVLTLFNSGSEANTNVTIKPIVKDRYINIRFTHQHIEHIQTDRFKAGAVKQFFDWPLVVTVAPTCPDGYKAVVYLVLNGDGYKETIRQFVVEVSNAGMLKRAPVIFSELYGGLGVKHAPRTPGSGGGASKNGRDSDAINATIAKYQMEVYYCYQQQLRRYPTLKGKVVVRFTIRPSGSIAAARIVGSTINNENVESCLMRRIKTWRFSAISKSHGDLSITYPFNFKDK